VIAGFVLLLSAYVVYFRFLGGIDGLSQLPDRFQPPQGPAGDLGLPPARHENIADVKLRMAFGEQSKVLGRTIKLEIRNKGMVLACDEFEIEKDGEHQGQVRLEPFSLAIFGKTEGDATPEINTVSSDLAYLEFDQPITNLGDLNNRKIVAGMLRGNVELVNNRRTPQRGDDLSLFTTGPVYFQDKLHRVWTQEAVRIVDNQTKPEPTLITGVGMDVFLTSEDDTPRQGAPAARKAKGESVSGVKEVHLRSTVAMYLWVDGRSGFLGANPADVKPTPPGDGKRIEVIVPSSASGPLKKPAQQVPEPEKAKVVIQTDGPFHYDVLADHATFDIPTKQGLFPNTVTATRTLEQDRQKKSDQLQCDHLELQFRRKSNPDNQPPPAAQDDHSYNLEIETAHATGGHVVLTSDAEDLEAHGHDLFYDARKRQTTLKGAPMVAVKNGHKIVASELCMEGLGQKEIQQARVNGPGKVDLYDRTTDSYPNHALWKEGLLFAKEGGYDCLTLVGDASFIDDDHGQRLRGERLRVWLQPAEPGAPAGNDQQRLRPHHLEATGHVTADSPELHVKEPTEHLVVWFRDAPPAALPVAVPEQPGQKPAANGPAASAAAPAGTATAPSANPAAGATAAAPPAKPKQPINLCARSIETYVVRTGAKNELDKLWCEGAVAVHQDPATPEEKGVDIQGDTLQLNHFPEGNVLVVTGKLARVQLDKLTIHGPEVNIDQKNNNAWVTGAGAMEMPATTNLSGEQLAKPGELTVHWNKDMFFNGNCAEFHGGVQAEQGNGRLLCQEMQVFLDRPVSFKEGEKRDQQPKVRTLVCDKSVRVEDATWEGRKLVKYDRLSSPAVSMDNEEGVVQASGPGVVHLLQLGSADDNGFGPPPRGPAPQGGTPAKGKPAPEELKLTRVTYLGHLHANNKTRTAIFYDGVEVFNLPADNPDLPLDADHLAPGCMYLRCEQLKVFKSQDNHLMEANKHVLVRTQEFWALAEVVKYDEGKDLVIFEGGEGGMATLYRIKAQGSQPEKITAKKILYWRKTNDFNVEGGSNLEGTASGGQR
jgi:lipopolysaccharide export system protein LptA